MTSVRTKLLDAALSTIRARGYAGTSVDDLCRAAGVTKGAFFHYFPTKEALAVAAAEHWSATTAAMFADAPYHRHADPLDRVLAYIDFRRELIRGDASEFSCLVGTMVQEAYATSDPIRTACRRSIEDHAATLEADFAAALADRDVRGATTAKSLALYTQATIQGAFILAKATGDVRVAIDSVEHLKRYIELLMARRTPHP